MAVGGRELSIDMRVVIGQILSLSAASGCSAVVGLPRGGHQTLATGGAEVCVLATLATCSVVWRPLVLRVSFEGGGQAATESG